MNQPLFLKLFIGLLPDNESLTYFLWKMW